MRRRHDHWSLAPSRSGILTSVMRPLHLTTGAKGCRFFAHTHSGAVGRTVAGVCDVCVTEIDHRSRPVTAVSDPVRRSHCRDVLCPQPLRRVDCEYELLNRPFLQWWFQLPCTTRYWPQRAARVVTTVLKKIWVLNHDEGSRFRRESPLGRECCARRYAPSIAVAIRVASGQPPSVCNCRPVRLQPLRRYAGGVHAAVVIVRTADHALDGALPQRQRRHLGGLDDRLICGDGGRHALTPRHAPRRGRARPLGSPGWLRRWRPRPKH
jgi:hypothetical protein